MPRAETLAELERAPRARSVHQRALLAAATVDRVPVLSVRVGRDLRRALDDDARNYLEVITSSARRMDEMIGALLRYARVGGDSAPFEAVDLGAHLISQAGVQVAQRLVEEDRRELEGLSDVIG